MNVVIFGNGWVRVDEYFQDLRGLFVSARGNVRGGEVVPDGIPFLEDLELVQSNGFFQMRRGSFLWYSQLRYAGLASFISSYSHTIRSGNQLFASQMTMVPKMAGQEVAVTRTL